MPVRNQSYSALMNIRGKLSSIYVEENSVIMCYRISVTISIELQLIALLFSNLNSELFQIPIGKHLYQLTANVNSKRTKMHWNSCKCKLILNYWQTVFIRISLHIYINNNSMWWRSCRNTLHLWIGHFVQTFSDVYADSLFFEIRKIRDKLKLNSPCEQ